jgi:hypothetical protein
MSYAAAGATFQRGDRLMNLPDSLPARLYLLAYDTDKDRPTARSHLGLVLRPSPICTSMGG